jgi:hypothetical protein
MRSINKLKQSFNFSVFIITSAIVGFANAATDSSNTATSTSTTSLSAAPTATFSFKNETSQLVQKANTIGGANTDNQLKAVLNITPKLGVGVLVGGYKDIANSTQAQSQISFKDMDLAVLVNGKTDGILGSDISIIEGRVYLPTSPYSKSIGQASRLRMDLLFPKNLGDGFSASLLFRPNYFTMNADSKLSSYFGSLTSLRGTYNFTKDFDIYASLDHTYDSVDNKQTAIKTDKEVLGPQIGVEYKFSKYFKASLDAEQARNINEPAFYNVRKEYALFDANDTTYRFIGVITY